MERSPAPPAGRGPDADRQPETLIRTFPAHFRHDFFGARTDSEVNLNRKDLVMREPATMGLVLITISSGGTR